MYKEIGPMLLIPTELQELVKVGIELKNTNSISLELQSHNQAALVKSREKQEHFLQYVGLEYTQASMAEFERLSL